MHRELLGFRSWVTARIVFGALICFPRIPNTAVTLGGESSAQFLVLKFLHKSMITFGGNIVADYFRLQQPAKYQFAKDRYYDLVLTNFHTLRLQSLRLSCAPVLPL